MNIKILSLILCVTGIFIFYSSKPDEPFSQNTYFFDESKNATFHMIVNDFSLKHDLKVVRANENSLKKLPVVKKSFSVYLFLKDDGKSWLISMSHFVNNEITILTYDNGNIPIDLLNETINALVNELKENQVIKKQNN